MYSFKQNVDGSFGKFTAFDIFLFSFLINRGWRDIQTCFEHFFWLFFIFTHLKTCVVYYRGCGWHLSVSLEIKRFCLFNFCHLGWDLLDCVMRFWLTNFWNLNFVFEYFSKLASNIFVKREFCSKTYNALWQKFK